MGCPGWRPWVCLRQLTGYLSEGVCAGSTRARPHGGRRAADASNCSLPWPSECAYQSLDVGLELGDLSGVRRPEFLVLADLLAQTAVVGVLDVLPGLAPVQHVALGTEPLATIHCHLCNQIQVTMLQQETHRSLG